MAEQPELVDGRGWEGVPEGDLATRKALGPIAGATAEVESECDECGFSIAPGDPIVLAVEGGPWIHGRCGP